ncbi:type II toxin-antitoxin system RelE/ParE family toxin [Niastella sp. OAS944]|uniref:type II toxin-antitoxin system RelE/ParE family toxin n=1 Tax=Niastella sp. OAS944 TaxID=2664089 RepID=UPI00349A67C9|nr:plasmid stabilization system protein ParE [Chitinophagaceae bacterium OAS944]
MVNVQWEIVFDSIAKEHLKEAYDYIKNDSPQNAVKVLARITASISKLAKDPEKYSPDKYRLKNDGSYRAYEIDRYRITYKISPPQIFIIRIRHTSREPLKY